MTYKNVSLKKYTFECVSDLVITSCVLKKADDSSVALIAFNL